MLPVQLEKFPSGAIYHWENENKEDTQKKPHEFYSSKMEYDFSNFCSIPQHNIFA